MVKRFVTGTSIALFLFAAAGCGSTTPAGSGAGTGRVFFVSPKNGATIKTMSTIEFGSTGTTVGAVPAGTITEAQVRPNIIHYHLGVDTDCLPAGQIIPKADPWIHFGDGKNVIEMSLPAGQHRLAVQAGDDMHKTIAGMCEVINVTVVQ